MNISGQLEFILDDFVLGTKRYWFHSVDDLLTKTWFELFSKDINLKSKGVQ